MAEFFQDTPFSFPYTFIAMDYAFPNSKFILTISNTPEEWYNSSINFARKVFGNGNIPPIADDLKNAEYIYKGRAYYSHYMVYDVSDDNLYDKSVLIGNYNMHNEMVIDYSRYRPGDLLALNVAKRNAYKKLCGFLNLKSDRIDFPWKNKTEDVNGAFFKNK